LIFTSKTISLCYIDELSSLKESYALHAIICLVIGVLFCIHYLILISQTKGKTGNFETPLPFFTMQNSQLLQNT